MEFHLSDAVAQSLSTATEAVEMMIRKLGTRVTTLEITVEVIEGEMCNHVVSESERPEPSEPEADARQPYMVKVLAPVKGQPPKFELDEDDVPPEPDLTAEQRETDEQRLFYLEREQLDVEKGICGLKARARELETEERALRERLGAGPA